MATGDRPDFLARLKAVLPESWFPDSTPLLDAMLNGCAAGWAYCHALLAFVRLQSRRLTASGVFLDMMAADFFGTFIKRRVNESDALLSARIGRELFREKGTRAGLIAALTDLTGRAPWLVEPALPFDTGGYTAGGMAFGGAVWTSTRGTPGNYSDAAGALQTAPAGVARPLYANGALVGVMSEAAATNGVPNPRGEGAAAGTPGTPPSGWAITVPSGLSSGIVGAGTQNNMPYVDVRIFGTASASATATLYLNPVIPNAITATLGQLWTASAFLSLAAGSNAGVTSQVLYLDEYNVSTLAANHAAVISIAAAPALPRHSVTSVLSNASVNRLRVRLSFNVSSGAAVDFTVRVAAPQCEQGGAATSVMLPPIGAPGASSRAADALAASTAFMGAAYGVDGGYGSLALPFQFFLTAYRPLGQGVANVAGYGDIAAGVTGLPGGYGSGAMEYASPSMFAPQIADSDILAVINDVRPVAAIAWTRILS